MAQSISSVLVSAWVHDFAPKIRCMVLAAPALKVKLYVPLARAGLRLWLKLKDKAFVKSYVKAKFLTHDPAQIASYENDPLISRSIAVNILLDLDDAATRVIADAAAIQVPTQVLISGADWVVRQKPQRIFFERLGSAVKEQHLFAEFYHDTLNEKDSHLPIGKAREFILRQFEKPAHWPALLKADQHGHTKLEYDALTKPLAPSSLKGLYFAATRMALRRVGRLSAGMRIGLDCGFDSGTALDYVYRNRPQGITPLGKLIDRGYLNSTGWRGIRQRKIHLARLIRATVQTLQQRGRPLRFLDIAAGHGRYLLEALLELKDGNIPFEALLRDYSQANVERGCQLIRDMGLER
ncbi:MAG TPA: class I SAM-dependent methyltransferase family protein, partial [Candidatus Binatus sp.]|nr:class I SAM-dependent methyltransferase family protein [Candidatus Binatus sp.]